MAAAVKEPAPRIVSPVLLVLAGLCFLLPFAGVSCNTTTATAELGSLSSISQELGGGASVSEPAGLTGCLNSLDNHNFATYTGLDLTAGSAPSVAGAEPSGCSALTKEEGSSSSLPTSADANQIGLGVQPLLLVALVAMLLSLLLSLTRFGFRGLAVAAAAAVAIILLVVEQGQVGTQLLDKISQRALGSVSGSGLPGIPAGLGTSSLISAQMSAYFSVTVGIGFILAIVALAVVALYNLAVQLVPLLSEGARAGAAVPNGVFPAPPPWAGAPGDPPAPSPEAPPPEG
jgi:hypothetical protein